jgi:hypothetical protein
VPALAGHRVPVHLLSVVLSNPNRRSPGAFHARPQRCFFNHGKPPMNFTFVSVGPLIALIAGILILIMPRLLNFIVAIYLIVIGVLGLAGPHL